MAKIQSWTLEEAVLQSKLKFAAIDALASVSTKNLILKDTGKTVREALTLNEKLNIMIDLQVRPEMAYDNPYAKQMETWDQAEQTFAAEKAKNYVKPMLPYKTGNLRNNALKVIKTGDEWKIYIDYAVAPYALYPNVKRIIDQNWPTIKQRFARQVESTLGSRAGLYNNQGAVKVAGGGFRDEFGEFIKVSAPGEKSRWGYVRY